jgi:hypothetical protein
VEWRLIGKIRRANSYMIIARLDGEGGRRRKGRGDEEEGLEWRERREEKVCGIEADRELRARIGVVRAINGSGRR